VALRLDVVDLDRIDPGVRGTAAKEGDQLLDLVATALGVDERVCVLAEDPELAGAAHGGLAQADILDLPGDPGPNRVLGLRLLRGHGPDPAGIPSPRRRR
jgi:hypothetical protein